MLKNEKILLTGPTSQVAFPIARELAKHSEVYGLSRLSSARDRARLEAIGLKCISADMAGDSFDHVPDDFTYVLNFAVLKTDSFDQDLAANAEGLGRLIGVEPQFVETDRVLASIVLDLTRMHQLVGATAVDWRDGMRRMIQARHPERPLRGA